MNGRYRTDHSSWTEVTAILVLAAVALVLLLAGCSANGGGTETTAPGGTGGGAQVTMSGFAFAPASVTVSIGDNVTWTNEDAAQHDVVADNGEFSSGLLGQGESFSFTFQTAGTFPYHCSVHPSMTGTVTVQ